MCTNDIYVHIYTPWYSLLTAPLRTTNCASLAILDNAKAPPTEVEGAFAQPCRGHLTFKEGRLHASGSRAV